MNKRSVMILDGNTREALAIARSFGRKKINVIIGGYSRLSRAFYSKYCKAYFLYPEGNDLTRDTHKTILHYVKKFKPDVLMPILNKTFSVLLQHKEEYIPHTNLIPLPDDETFRLMEDKTQLLKLALKNNIPSPQTFYPKNLDDLKFLSQKLSYPILIKPRISAGGFGIRMVFSSQDLWEKYIELVNMKRISFPDSPFDSSFPIIQEHLSGDLINFYAYSEKGAVKAFFMTKTLRGYPLMFGPGIAAVSVRNEFAKEISLKIIKLLNWNGIIGFQYILDKRDGTPKIIDSNPRFWGTVENAILSGVDFPYMLFQKAIGKEVTCCFDYKEGREFRWVLFGELFYLLQSKNKIKTIADYLSFRKTHCEISLTDIKPHIIHTFSLLRNKREVR
ncbi:MAG: ATP-grasp domain-containing protein [Candidatus Omnitrophica bacterium]|nr:ATP-grasp domain-containing protein [Candidatus Omnitrophota bacterium]MCF7891956.1 ATP-grasp domain-containing protein [Candidatus Omnitrophota bacterium]MCF7895482.1 ATP-grasp domain-containing protein [Candidatus Omnitrophota bacterium]MCF7898005.1 ATP-grasp domain-containing protein [Candidatus Omnitrophota bacterium]MCF7909641.1 ATP-grasp domain-containing protein [Candidatus Omnitrophota bacterium]